MIMDKATPSIGDKIHADIIRELALIGGIELAQGLNGLKQGIVFFMGSKRQRGQKLRGKLTDVAIVIVEEIIITIGFAQGFGFLNGCSQLLWWNGEIDALPQLGVINRLIEHQLANLMQKHTMSTGCFRYFSLILLQG